MEKKWQTLTKAEMQVMNIVWSLSDKWCYVNDVIEKYEEPKPAYTTIATFMKILNMKGFLKCKKEQQGKKQNIFSPTLSKDEYRRRVMSEIKSSIFDDSASSFLSFFVREEKLSESDIKELINLVNNQ